MFYWETDFKDTKIGNIPKTWQVDKLSSLIEKNWITYHLDGNHGERYPRKEDFLSQGIPFLSANMIANGNIDLTKAKYLAEEWAKQLTKGIAKDDDVLLAHNATVGAVTVLKIELPYVILGTSLTSYRCNSNHLHNQYLRYYMESLYYQIQLQRIMKQTTRNQVPITAQRRLLFVIPSLQEQQSIAETLSCVDLAIQKTDEVVAKTERLKEGLMQQLLTKGIGHKEFKDTEIGKIPKEWICEKVGSVAGISRGAGYQYIKKLSLHEDGINLVRINDFVSFNPIKVAATHDIMRYLVHSDDILFAGTGASAGITMLVDEKMDGYAHSYNALLIKPQKIVAKFLYFCLNSSFVRRQESFKFI